MATAKGIALFSDMGLVVPRSYNPKFKVQYFCRGLTVNCSQSPGFVGARKNKGLTVNCSQSPGFAIVVARKSKSREFSLFKSVELDRFITSGDEDEMSEGFFEAIEELERMVREPSDVLEEMNEKLSARELQLVLVYFSQEGKDSWCALEVYEWLRKENRVDKETMELMVSIMCGWVRKLIEEKSDTGDVVDLLVDMDCVGLKPSFSMIEKVISLYWEAGEKDAAVLFVKEVLARGIACSDDHKEEHKGGPTGYLAWKMMVIVICFQLSYTLFNVCLLFISLYSCALSTGRENLNRKQKSTGEVFLWCMVFYEFKLVCLIRVFIVYHLN